MSRQCRFCGSYAINPNHYGRLEGVDTDLCDVCYWRKAAISNERVIAHMSGRFYVIPEGLEELMK